MYSLNIKSKIFGLSILSLLIGSGVYAQDNGYTDYNEGYNNQDNSANNNQNYNDQNYSNQDYNNQNYNNQNYNDQNYSNQNYNNQYYNNQDNNGYYNNGYDQYGNAINNGYGNYNTSSYNNMDYNSDYSVFYNQLAPYGQWYNDPQYGYVWVPQVDANFRPYLTNGYWAMTQYGNMWMSQYPWGWATFHYGRWTYSNFYGWMWIPGSEWGPAWVNWRQGDGYYGWAPLGPGVSISMSLGSGFSIGLNWWNFIPSGNIYSRDLYSYYNPSRYGNIYGRTNIINNTFSNNRNIYASGPSRNDVSRYVSGNIPEYKVNMQQGFNNRGGSGTTFNSLKGNSISVITPNFTRTGNMTSTSGNRNTQIAPKNVQPMTRGNLSSAQYFNGNASTSKAPSQPSTSQFSNNYNGMNSQVKTSSANSINNNNSVNFSNTNQVNRPNSSNIQQVQQSRQVEVNNNQLQQNTNTNRSFNQSAQQSRQIESASSSQFNQQAQQSRQIQINNNNAATQSRQSFNTNNSFSAPQRSSSNSFSAPERQMSAPKATESMRGGGGGFNRR